MDYAPNIIGAFRKHKGLGSLPQSNSQKIRLRIDDPTIEKLMGQQTARHSSRKKTGPIEKPGNFGKTGFLEDREFSRLLLDRVSRIQKNNKLKTNKKLWQELTTHLYA